MPSCLHVCLFTCARALTNSTSSAKSTSSTVFMSISGTHTLPCMPWSVCPFLCTPWQMELSRHLRQHSREIAGKTQLFMNAFARALEVRRRPNPPPPPLFQTTQGGPVSVAPWLSLDSLCLSVGALDSRGEPLTLGAPWVIRYPLALASLRAPVALSAPEALCNTPEGLPVRPSPDQYCGSVSCSLSLCQLLLASLWAPVAGGAPQVIPRQLCDNAGFDSIDVLNRLRHKHSLASGELHYSWAAVSHILYYTMLYCS